MNVFEINWLAVLAATFAAFIIGAIWFGPKTFYPIWMKFQGRPIPTERVEMSAAETGTMFGGTFVGAFIQVTTLAIFINLAHSIDANFGPAQGALAGSLLGFGIAAAASFSHRMFGQSNYKVFDAVKVWLLEVSQDITSLTVAGLILASWL
jgi:hypothetical protein